MWSSFRSGESIILQNFQEQFCSVMTSSIASCYRNCCKMDARICKIIRQNGACLRFKSSVPKIQSFHSMERNTMRGSSLLCNNSRSSFPALSRSSNEKRRAEGKEKFSDSGQISTPQGVHKLTVKSGKDETRINTNTGGKKDHFHNWSLEKIREEGPLAVPVVEELRKSFAPGTQPLQDDNILKELNEWKSLSSIDVNSSPICISVANKSTTNDKALLSPRSRSSRKKKSSGKEGQSGSHDSNDDGDDDDEDWHPMLREFPTYHAKEEALYFHNLLAYPWEKRAFDRYVSKLEEKFFPDDLLDFDKPSLASRRSRNECSGNSRKVVFGSSAMTKHKEDIVPYLNNASNQSSCSASAPSSSLDEGAEDSQITKGRSKQMLQPCMISDPKPKHSRATLGSVDNFKGVKKHSLKSEPQVNTTTRNNNPDRNWETPKRKGFSTLTTSQPVEELTKAICNQASAQVSLIAKPFLLKRNKRLPLNWDGDAGTVVLIDKPKGWTSFAVCAQLRRLLSIQKVGHAGTLDPMATGLLVVCIGKATKLADSYQAMKKVYSGAFRLGEATPSYDADSEVCERLSWSHIQDIDIQKVKESFVGDIMQVPPMYSAIKVAGERLYKKARRGEEIEIPPRMVSIYDLEVDRSLENKQDVNFRVVCSKGTYIRSLCADFGRALNSCAHLTRLRREKIDYGIYGC